MAKAKKEKMEANPFKLKKELPLLPGYIIVVLWTAFIFCMIGWIILASLSTTKEIFTGGLLASGLHFENYTKALFTNKAALNLLNSVIYTVPSCILIIVVCAPAAYCMSRFKFHAAVFYRQCAESVWHSLYSDIPVHGVLCSVYDLLPADLLQGNQHLVRGSSRYRRLRPDPVLLENHVPSGTACHCYRVYLQLYR